MFIKTSGKIVVVCCAVLLPVIAPQANFARSSAGADQEMRLGATYYYCGHVREAISAFTNAIRLNPKLWPAHLDLAHIYAQEDYIAAEIQELKAVLKEQPGKPDVLLALGDALRTEGDLPAALDAYRKAAGAGANPGLSYYTHGVMLFQAADWDGAIAEMRRAASANPVFPEAHMTLAAALFKKGEMDAALNETQIAIEQKNACYPQGHILRACVFRAAGRTMEALGEYKLAAKQDPANVAAWRGIGDLALIRKDFGTARIAYQAVVNSHPHDQDARAALALAREKQTRIAQVDEETGSDADLDHILNVASHIR